MSWQKVKLGALYEVHNGLSKPRDAFGDGFPFLSYSTVFNNFFLPDQLDSLVRTDAKEQESYSIKTGDVFITRTSETSDELGMSCVALKDYPSATYNGFCKRLRPVTDKVLPKYIGYYLRAAEFRSRFDGLGAAMITRASLKNEDLLAMTVKLPAMPVQRKIADILGAYDDLIENNCRRIALLEKMARELYRERFCRRKYIANKMAIGELIVENAKSKIKAGDCKGGVGNIPFFTSGSSIYWCNDGLVDGVNLYLNTGGSSDVKIHNGEASYSTDTWSISSDKDNIYFLFHYLKTFSDSGELFSSYFKGATIQHLQKTDFRKHEISIPEPDELASFNALVIPMHLAADNLKKQNQRLCTSRDRLLPRLMSGKIDLDKLVKGEEVKNG